MLKVGDRVRVNKPDGYGFGDNEIWKEHFHKQTVLTIEELGSSIDIRGNKDQTVRCTNFLKTSWCVAGSDVTLYRKPTVIVGE